MNYAIGVDIGGTNVKAVAVAPDGKPLFQNRFESEDRDGAAWLSNVDRTIREVETSLGAAKCIGIASPGLAAEDGRSIRWMRGRMQAVEGLDWTTLLQRPGIIPVLNDAHAALLGEVWLGAARDARDAVLLTLGTGVGGAILSGGRLLEGRLGRAGHLGHMSLDPNGPPDIVNTPGSLEDAIGEHTLPRRSGGRFGTTVQLVTACSEGDEIAAAIWLQSIRALAAGIASIINIVDPEIIVIGGGMAHAGDTLFIPLDRELDRLEWRPTGETIPIVPAMLGEWAGAYGAARHAMQRETTGAP
jgi:glucokinase